MSMYDYEKEKLTIEITKHQKAKVKEYCKIKGLTVTMLIRLFIDELRVSQMDESIRRNIAEQYFKIDNLVTDRFQEGFNDDNGNKKQVWFSKLIRR